MPTRRALAVLARRSRSSAGLTLGHLSEGACMSFSLLRTFSPRRLTSRTPERSACTSLSLRRVIRDASRPLARHVSAPTAHARRPLGRRIRGEHV